ncbi:histone deacetylase HDT1-like [Papaver somniferum]|uniref:histone deacetylase HDT1-like n=1 Tax=Papaver somniferum TaxID=3469 RepID=UPI000E701F05|nr:histone deacetylase HDT1-like [Papaver somniferum]
MAASISSDYDSDYSSISSEEDSKIFVAKSRANADHAKEIINRMSLDEMKAARGEILKRKERDEIIADYREKRRRNQQKILKAEEKLRSRPDGVASKTQMLQMPRKNSNSDLVEEEEFPSSDSDSEKESDEDSTEDDDDADDDESDDYSCLRIFLKLSI